MPRRRCNGLHTSISDATGLEDLPEAMSSFPDLHFIHVDEGVSTDEEAQKTIKAAARKKAREVAKEFCASRPCSGGDCIWTDVDYFYNSWKTQLPAGTHGEREWTVVLTIKSIECECREKKAKK